MSSDMSNSDRVQKLHAGGPTGPIEKRWDQHRFDMKLVNPANRRKFKVLVVGTGLAGGSAAATLGEMGYNVQCFFYQDSPRRAHSVAAQGGINAAKNYRNDGDSIYRLFYDTVKGGDFRSREANVYRLAQVSNNIIDQCVAQGVPFAREYGGTLDNRSFGGAQVSRTFYARGQTGQQLLLGAYQALERQIHAGTVQAFSRSEMLDLVIVDYLQPATTGAIAAGSVRGRAPSTHSATLATCPPEQLSAVRFAGFQSGQPLFGILDEDHHTVSVDVVGNRHGHRFEDPRAKQGLTFELPQVPVHAFDRHDVVDPAQDLQPTVGPASQVPGGPWSGNQRFRHVRRREVGPIQVDLVGADLHLDARPGRPVIHATTQRLGRSVCPDRRDLQALTPVPQCGWEGPATHQHHLHPLQHFDGLRDVEHPRQLRAHHRGRVSAAGIPAGHRVGVETRAETGPDQRFAVRARNGHEPPGRHRRQQEQPPPVMR